MRIFLFSLCMTVLWLMGCSTQPQNESPAVTLEFTLAQSTPGQGLKEAVIVSSGETIYLQTSPSLTAKDFVLFEASSEKWGKDDVGNLSITFQCSKDGAAKLQALTQANLKKRLAIVLDGKVLLAPEIIVPIGEKGVIEGRFTTEERDEIVENIQRAMR